VSGGLKNLYGIQTMVALAIIGGVKSSLGLY